MKKDSFLEELQKRAGEQQFVLHDIPFPNFFLLVSRRLGENPWKIMIPLCAGIAIGLHLFLGESFDEKILWLFGSI